MVQNLFSKLDEFENLYPLEITLISQIMPFMHVCVNVKGDQHGLKRQLLLVPGNLSKEQRGLPWYCENKYLIPLSLKRRLSDEIIFNKQYI